MIYFIAGASGSGKSAIIEDLKSLLPDAVIHDFDDIGVPKNADKKWRQESTELWLQRYLKERDSVNIFCICGQVVLGEVLACPSAKQLDKLNFCLLDVSDFERIQRLKKRNTYGLDQNMLNWAAWLRIHHQDPQWEQHVLSNDCWDGLDLSAWNQLTNWDNKSAVTILDTTSLPIDQVAKDVADWINEKDNQRSELVLNFEFGVSTSKEIDYINNIIVDYNVEQVPATQKNHWVPLNYCFKNKGVIIAGINAEMYVWKILYVSILFVEKAYRKNKLGSYLLRKVESEAKKMGATLVHLDTFDFQAKDFYLKQGYEIFGILEDCPPGHKRYYLKKIL